MCCMYGQAKVECQDVGNLHGIVKGDMRYSFITDILQATSNKQQLPFGFWLCIDHVHTAELARLSAALSCGHGCLKCFSEVPFFFNVHSCSCLFCISLDSMYVRD